LLAGAQMYRPAEHKQQRHQLGNFTLSELEGPSQIKGLASPWICSCVLSKEQGTAMINLRTSCILMEPWKTQGLSVLDGGIGKDLYLQKCQLPAIAGEG